MLRNQNLSAAFIDEHNSEASEVWTAFHSGKPLRPPVFLGTNTQYFFYNDELNPNFNISFESLFTDPQIFLDFNLQAALWRIDHIAPFCDDPIALPEKFYIRIDFQNFEETTYFGAPLEFLPDQIPDTRPFLTGKNKEAIFNIPYPDPMTGGSYARAHQLCEGILELVAKQPTFMDRPIVIEPFGYWTGGFLTLAISLRGNELLTDLIDDPDYVLRLLDYLYEGILQRVKKYHDYFNLPFPGPDLFFTDDSIQLISTKMVDNFLMPYYQRYKAAVTTAEKIKMHLCGDATRHFKLLQTKLGVNEFETGFPIDFGKTRAELGPDVTIQGGPNVMILRDGTTASVRNETQRILNSGVLDGGRFILREGNNLAPHTPQANLDAMYQEARKIKFNWT